MLTPAAAWTHYACKSVCGELFIHPVLPLDASRHRGHAPWIMREVAPAIGWLTDECGSDVHCPRQWRLLHLLDTSNYLGGLALQVTTNEDVYVRTFGTTWGMLSPRPLSCESSCLVVVTVGIFCNSLLLFGSCLTVNWFKLIVQWLISDFYRVLHNYCQRKNRIGVDGPLSNPVHWSNFMGNWNWLLNKWNVCCFGCKACMKISHLPHWPRCFIFFFVQWFIILDIAGVMPVLLFLTLKVIFGTTPTSVPSVNLSGLLLYSV